MSLPHILLKHTFSTKNIVSVIKNVTVIGGALVGSAIAQLAAQTGHNVTLVEVNLELLQKADTFIGNNLENITKERCKAQPSDAEKFINDTRARLKLTTNLNDAVSDTDLVIEAITENLQAKQRLFRSIDRIAQEKTMFVSSSSSLPISEIASATKRLDRFGGLHFFSPIPLMKLLEVVRTPEMSQETYQKLLDFGKTLGHTCLSCSNASEFVVNRLLVSYGNEMVKLL